MSVSIVVILFIVAIVLTGDNGGGWACKHRKSGPGLRRGLTQASDNHPGRGEREETINPTTWTWIKHVTNQISRFPANPREAGLVCSPPGGVCSLMRV